MANREYGPDGYGPQGPGRYFGRLQWSQQGGGIIALIGPTLDRSGTMACGEVYRWLPSQLEMGIVPVVSHTWLSLQIGKDIEIFHSVKEGLRGKDMWEFRIQENDGTVTKVIF